TDRKAITNEIARVKAERENLAGEEEQRQTAEMEANEQFRTDQRNSADSKTEWIDWKRSWIAIRISQVLGVALAAGLAEHDFGVVRTRLETGTQWDPRFGPQRFR